VSGTAGMASLTQILLELETRLMDPQVRRTGLAAELIADDFVEFGGNGRIFNKTDALAMMRHHAPRVFALEEFNIRELTTGIALVTYRVQSQAIEGGPGRVSMRSSIWVEREGRWQVTFHQATMLT
jgi:hypothetical protein